MPFSVVVGFSKHHFKLPPLLGRKRHSINLQLTHLPFFLLWYRMWHQPRFLKKKTKNLWQGVASQAHLKVHRRILCGLGFQGLHRWHGSVPGPCVSIWHGSHFLSRPDTGTCESAGWNTWQVKQKPGKVARDTLGNQRRLSHKLNCS